MFISDAIFAALVERGGEKCFIVEVCGILTITHKDLWLLSDVILGDFFLWVFSRGGRTSVSRNQRD